MFATPDPFAFLLGLPMLRPGALWSRAVALDSPILVGANALSRWYTDWPGLRQWADFDGRHLGLVAHHRSLRQRRAQGSAAASDTLRTRVTQGTNPFVAHGLRI